MTPLPAGGRTQAYWLARGNRAVGMSLVRSNALLATHGETLDLLRRTLSLKASLLSNTDTNGWERLGTQLADYHRAVGRLSQRTRQLAQRLERFAS